MMFVEDKVGKNKWMTERQNGPRSCTVAGERAPPQLSVHDSGQSQVNKCHPRREKSASHVTSQKSPN